jgi:hypothetical protein
LIINRASFYAVIVRNELMMIQDVWEKLIRIVGKHDKNIPILESETLLFVHEPWQKMETESFKAVTAITTKSLILNKLKYIRMKSNRNYRD